MSLSPAEFEILDLVTEDIYSAQELLACVATDYMHDDLLRRREVLSTLARLQREKLVDVRDDGGNDWIVNVNDAELQSLGDSPGNRVLFSATEQGSTRYREEWRARERKSAE